MGDTHLGVLGVGRMGLSICARLVETGFDVTAFDIRPERQHAAEDVGTAWASTALTLAASSPLLITVLSGTPELKQAMRGTAGALSAMASGTCWLDLTSSDPRVVRDLASSANARSILAVGAPMGGGVEAAESGDLTLFVGGTAAAIDRARPVLSAIGRDSDMNFLGDDVGAGYAAKLLSNLLWFGQSVATTEALLLGQAMGLDLTLLRTALATSAGDSAFIDRHLDSLLAGDYLEVFGLDRCVDELEIVTSLAADENLPFELSTLVTRLHQEALTRFGPVDGELLVAKLLEERTGTLLRAVTVNPATPDLT